jgi:predicted PhzF superfamily epimerase YddE/YHI9
MDLPQWPAAPCPTPDGLVAGLGATPIETFDGHYFMARFEDEAAVRALAPDFAALAEAVPFGVIATAPGDEVDVVSRFFAPNAGVDEDPVTGSAHCMLTPYWADRLGREELLARQVSERGGVVHCARRGDRCAISGNAVTYLVGEIRVP